MDSAKILDWDVLSALGLFPELNEEILWTGQPSARPEFPGGFLTLFDDFNPWILYYAVLAFQFAYGIETLKVWPFITSILMIIAFQIVPYIFEYQRITRTLYVVTNRRIVFRFWRLFQEKVHILRYNDFQSTTFVVDQPAVNKGTVYLMTGKEVGFWTYDMESGERRHHPTLESVRDPEALRKKIEQIRLAHLPEQSL
jgi:hypothetical protein